MKKARKHQKRPPRPLPAHPGIKPELLAPAGSPITWAAAVEAGADAVYLGLKEFSARAFASNFSIKDLARVTELTHERGAKVFVAFNAILKEEDLLPAAKALEALTHISPDALIVQDLGLLRLIKRHFPMFEVHASTLMAVHNAPGLSVLADLGYDRAVLARELTLTEVERLSERSPLGLEMFIHGALCFSFSGLCLMSSFLGGKGSLRGACTQPCRRSYTSGKSRGYFFSPTDLDSSSLMGRIRELPLAALKIEGRMKGAEYVSRVVRAYRLLLDAPEADFDWALSEAKSLIEPSMGRQRSTGFLLAARPDTALAPTLAATSGLFLGKIVSVGVQGGLLHLKHPVEVGDRLRVQFKRSGDRQAFSLKNMMINGKKENAAQAGEAAAITGPMELSSGDLIFKVDSALGEKDALTSPLVQALGAADSPLPLDRKPSPALKAAQAELRPVSSRGHGPTKRPALWYKLARTEEAIGLTQVKPARIILPLTTPNVKRMAGLRKRLEAARTHIVWSLPPLAFETAVLGQNAAAAVRMGAREFMISNLGHLPLLKNAPKGRGRNIKIYADHRLNCLNTACEAQLADLGLSGITLCLEADAGNVNRILGRPGPMDRLLYLYGRPPLFTSRFPAVGIKDNIPVESPRHERFRIRVDKSHLVVFAEKPVFFSPFLKHKSLAGVMAFIIDLEFDPRPLATAKDIHEAVHRGRPIKNASRFNLKRGLY